jgi:hypothetical protein
MIPLKPLSSRRLISPNIFSSLDLLKKDSKASKQTHKMKGAREHIISQLFKNLILEKLTQLPSYLRGKIIYFQEIISLGLANMQLRRKLKDSNKRHGQLILEHLELQKKDLWNKLITKNNRDLVNINNSMKE